jgi:hypothetical protein
MQAQSGSENGNADGLSRLQLPESPSHVPEPGDIIMLMGALQGTPCSYSYTHQKVIQSENSEVDFAGVATL